MTRARVLTAVLAAILLLCAAAVYLDQQGFFGGEGAVSAPSNSTPSRPSKPAKPSGAVTSPATTDGDGYGELK